MKLPSTCPTDRQLAGMLEESLSADEQQAAFAHVETCPDCQRRLDHLAAGSEAAHLPLTALADQSFPSAGRSAPPAADVSARLLPPLDPPTEPGSLGRLGQYEVLEVVGRGGMGVVLKARDTRLNRIVAIKMLAPELAAHPTAHKRFLREAQAAAAVSHDHVVTIFAVEEGPAPFLVMEFIDGRSLQQKIDAEGELQLDEILRIGHQIAAGLAAAHAQGLIHRDIKPTNILLQNGIQRVQITDFGLARAVDDASMTDAGETPGTPQFMSPEQAQGLPVDHRADLFSLGCVLYAMCTGRSPFRAESPVAALRLVCDVTPRPIRAINPAIPAWLTKIIDLLLAKNPDDRFQSAAEVAELLARHLAHLQNPGSVPPPALAAKPHVAAHSNGHAGRRGWLIGALVLVALLTVLGATEATSVTNVAGTVIRVVAGEGALIVELDDPTIKVCIDGEELVITEAGAREVRVRPGRHRIAATKNGQPVPVSDELVTITRGGRQVVRVTYEPPAAPIEPAATPGHSATTKASSSAPLPLAAPFSQVEAGIAQRSWAEYLGVPVEFTGPESMRFRLIPPGQFLMGSPGEDVDEVARFVSHVPLGVELVHSEAPQHEVILSQAWYCGVLEVLQAEYDEVCGENPSYFPKTLSRAGEITPAERRAKRPPRLTRLPLESITWNQAVEFCNRLSALDELEPAYVQGGEQYTLRPGSGYRLPTEAEWEFACRAGTNTRYWFTVTTTGNEFVNHAWCTRNAGRGTHPVGQLKQNAFGLKDITGNVAEWCHDGWDPNYYARFANQPAVDPTGPENGFSLRVFRGGGWHNGPADLRSAARSAARPERAADSIGMRVVLPLAGVKAVLAARQAKSPAPSPEPPTPAPQGMPP